ncbi:MULTISPECIES: DUF2917 domain-containing protein [Paraburkholderia]|uniref:DUF2917 domain-containing protein n=1 Tax=Paraburkholderia TaxID=1822464 RepID=UPI00225B645E|nr:MULTISPECIES: DUF2917 domain-containing protein [Paraburkholderia]MCX4163990.1 DUF2917 domain-containing protein [Paraburkholderia megapolitana]MDN7159485.1 DUF2917 domain-containing protein [Paraburkholderia sp. CHISQ3]MDQ6496532.1 DUF2917 domain-containing protein [Paraburkholderia megapolitana]
MREISSSIVFEIKSGETVPMRVTRSTRLAVSGGPVWVTRSDDTRDYWLQPGHTLRLRSGERLWLSAESDLAANVAFSVPGRCDQRVRGWLGRIVERLTMHLQRDGWRTV